MAKERLDIVKKEVRSVIITYPEGVSVRDFLKAYRELIGLRFPTREFGYMTDVDFLYSLEDVVRIHTDKSGDYRLCCIADENTKHIQKLVVKQRKPKTKERNSFFHRNQGNLKEFKTKPFISATLRRNLFLVLSEFPDGLCYQSLLLAYKKKFKRPLNLNFLSDEHEDRLQRVASAVAELKLRIDDGVERLLYCPQSERMNEGSSKSPQKSSSNETKAQLNGKKEDISAIPKIVKNNFEKVLKLYPDGILAKHFPIVYEKFSGELFDLLDFGYTDFMELVDAFPDIFASVKSHEHDWRLFHPSFSKEMADYRKSMNKEKKITYKKCQKIEINKEDIALPTSTYTPAKFPSNIDLSSYIPVFISAIEDPSCFWFKLQIDEVVSKFRELEEKMQSFYHSSSGYSLKIPIKDIKAGSICAAFHDDHWYRATVAASPIDNIVTVCFIDYGGSEEINVLQLRYLKFSFFSLPSQAFKATLASVKPSNESQTWSCEAKTQFTQLCSNIFLMAKVHLEFTDWVSVFLCDTSGKEDLHINDALVDLGLAISSPEISYFASDSMENNEIKASESNNDSEMQFSLRNDDCLKQLIEKLASKQTSQVSSQEKLKLVKRICIDNRKFHIILVLKEAFISCDGVCNLFWCNKPAELLKERLEFKHVEIPTKRISKEEYNDLFNQCENYSIPGFHASTNENYSVALYSLVDVLKVLNTLGHPSINVREVIKTELKQIKQSNETTYQFSSDMEDIVEKTSHEKQSEIDNYCMYDLKALYEAVKCKRIRLQNQCNGSSIKELIQIEALSEIIKSRMDCIQSICDTYKEEDHH